MKHLTDSVTLNLSNYIHEVTSGSHEFITLGFLLTGPMVILLGCLILADLCKSKPRRYY